MTEMFTCACKPATWPLVNLVTHLCNVLKINKMELHVVYLLCDVVVAIRYTIIIGRYSGQCIFALLITVYVFIFYYAHVCAGIIDHSLLVPLGLPMLGPASHSFSLSCASMVNGCCRCTDDLLQLATATVPQPGHCWLSYHTPIQVDQLVPFLNSHPDTAFATYILDGLTIGFRIGFNYRHCSLHSRGSNHPSTGRWSTIES